MKLVEDNEKRLQEEQKNTEDEMNGLFLVHESCESDGMDLQEESVYIETAENKHLFPELNSFGEKHHTYNVCSKTFSVIKHIHTNTNEKPFLCTLCSKSFRRKKTSPVSQSYSHK